MPDAKGLFPQECRPGALSHLAPALCPFTGWEVGGCLAQPWEPLKGWEIIPEELVYPGSTGQPSLTQKGGGLALWALSMSPDGLLPPQLPEAGACSIPIAQMGKLRPAETTGVAHMHQAEELTTRLEHLRYRT